MDNNSRNSVDLEIEEIEINFELSKYSIGQSVAYIDDFMPETIEVITGKSDGKLIFNHGSRSCIPEMVRLATKNEIQKQKRSLEQNS